MLSRDRLVFLLSYDPDTGVFTRNVSAGRGRRGERAGTVRPDGRRQIAIDGVLHLEQRLAFLWMTGHLPETEIDHENATPSDNRWSNLRPATRSQNEANKRLSSANTSGLKGVSWSKSRAGWLAQLKHNKRASNLGVFDCPAAAHFAYVIASHKAFGEFSRAA